MIKKTVFILIIAAVCFTSKSAVYNVLEFGARNNGLDLTTLQIQHAIDSCFHRGGGIVYVPQGEYLVGTLNLKSNVELHLEKGAVLKATTDLSHYQRHNE